LRRLRKPIADARTTIPIAAIRNTPHASVPTAPDPVFGNAFTAGTDDPDRLGPPPVVAGTVGCTAVVAVTIGVAAFGAVGISVGVAVSVTVGVLVCVLVGVTVGVFVGVTVGVTLGKSQVALTSSRQGRLRLVNVNVTTSLVVCHG
jgi:hypothetical protein